MNYPNTLYVKWMEGATKDEGFWFTCDFPVSDATIYRKEIMNSGIYQILNTATQERYIGSTKNFTQRWAGHKSFLRQGIHENKYLQADWDALGEDYFQFGIIEEADTNLHEREQEIIEGYKGVCYNILAAKAKPENVRTPPTKIRFTGEHRKLIDAALKQAGLRKTMKGWFPRLLMILLTNYLAEELSK